MPIKANIKGGITKLTTERKERTKYSGYHIVLNLNQRYKDDDPHLESDSKIFDEVVREKILNNLESFIKLGEGDSVEKVKSANIEYAIERGKNQQLHAHIMLQMEHTNKFLHLDYQKVKETIQKELGLPSVYFHSRLIRGSQQKNLSDYIDKNF